MITLSFIACVASWFAFGYFFAEYIWQKRTEAFIKMLAWWWQYGPAPVTDNEYGKGAQAFSQYVRHSMSRAGLTTKGLK